MTASGRKQTLNPVNTVANNLIFLGQYYDQESGNHYNYFRDYAPSLGRYVQSDPIGLRGGINTYSYALQNPLKYTDPRGLDVWLGGEVRAGLHLGLPGGFGGVTTIGNTETGEVCTVRVLCLRLGLGILAGGGTGVIGTFGAAHCGKDIGGITVGVGFDIIVPGATGGGGSADFGGGLGLGGSAGPDAGAGASAGIDFCHLQVLGCTNTPEDCKDC